LVDLQRTVYDDDVMYLAVGELSFVLAGIYFAFVMLISAISVSVTMLVLCVYHQASSHAAATCIPVPRWVSTASCQSMWSLYLTARIEVCTGLSLKKMLKHIFLSFPFPSSFLIFLYGSVPFFPSHSLFSFPKVN